MVKENIKDYKDALETRVTTFKELSKRGRWILNFGTFLLLFGMIIIFILVPLTKSVNIALLSMTLFYLAGALIVFIGRRLIESKGIPRLQSLYLSPDEKIFLEIFDALTFLEAHLEKKVEPAKYQCLKELREAHELMEQYWVPSEVQVIMKEIGNEVETFKEKFEENLIYTLEHALDKETIKTAYNTLTEFGEYFIDPSKEKLIDLNEKMDVLLHSEIARPRYPIVDFLKKYQVHKHAIVVGLILAAGSIPALVGFYYGSVSTDAAILAFVGISGPSIAVYLEYVLKKR